MNKEEFIRIAEKVSNGTADEQDLKKYNNYYLRYQQEHPEWENLELSAKTEIGQELFSRISNQVQQHQPEAGNHPFGPA